MNNEMIKSSSHLWRLDKCSDSQDFRFFFWFTGWKYKPKQLNIIAALLSAGFRNMINVFVKHRWNRTIFCNYTVLVIVIFTELKPYTLFYPNGECFFYE